MCERIENTFARYFGTFVYMLKKEKDFLDRVLSTDGFCMEHFAVLADTACRELSDSEFEKYFIPIAGLQKKRVQKHRSYIKSFAKSFDYRNAGKSGDFPKDALLRCGFLLNGEFSPKPKKLD